MAEPINESPYAGERGAAPSGERTTLKQAALEQTQLITTVDSRTNYLCKVSSVEEHRESEISVREYLESRREVSHIVSELAEPSSS